MGKDVTSPPYNVGKEYDRDLSIEEYRTFLRAVWTETKRVLVSEEYVRLAKKRVSEFQRDISVPQLF